MTSGCRRNPFIDGRLPLCRLFSEVSWGRLFVRAPTRGLQLLLGSQTDRCQSVPEGPYVLHPWPALGRAHLGEYEHRGGMTWYSLIPSLDPCCWPDRD